MKPAPLFLHGQKRACTPPGSSRAAAQAARGKVPPTLCVCPAPEGFCFSASLKLPLRKETCRPLPNHGAARADISGGCHALQAGRSWRSLRQSGIGHGWLGRACRLWPRPAHHRQSSQASALPRRTRVPGLKPAVPHMAKPRMLIPAASTRQPGKVDPQTVAMTAILAVPAWQRLMGIPQAAALSALSACTRPRDIVQAAQGARARRHAGGERRGCTCCGTGLGCRPIWTSAAGGSLGGAQGRSANASPLRQ